MTSRHPYQSLPGRNFWRTAVADVAPNFEDVYRKRFDVPADARVATAGSCFAQHVTAHLKRRFDFIDTEPAPPNLPRHLHARFGYGLYSARYGNIYSARRLRQLLEEALGLFRPADDIWEDAGRFYDPYRPTIEPDGCGSADEVRALRAAHLRAVHSLFAQCDVFILTLGTTETWRSLRDGAVYAVCPGTAAGVFDPTLHVFENSRFEDVRDDLIQFIRLARRIQPDIKFIFTVSPVPMVATGGHEHALAAGTYSKSVLRAVFGDLCLRLDYVDYFPAYELVASVATRGVWYDSNVRTVTREGVSFAMSCFLSEHPGHTRPEPVEDVEETEEICDDLRTEPPGAGA